MATTTFPQSRVPQLSRLQTIGIVAAVLGVVLLVVGYFAVGAEQFFRSYLFGFYFAMCLPIGCLGALFVQHLAGGAWGVTVRRMLEAGATTMPIMFILYIPIALAIFNVPGLSEPLYDWSSAEIVAHDPLLAHKQPWLSPAWVVGRSVIFFILWSLFAILIRRLSLEQDRTNNQATTDRMRQLSGIGAALFVVTVTFASFDWTMSLDAHWFSTIYGAHYIVSSVLLTLSFLILMLTQIRHTNIYKEYVTIKPIHDLGKLMMAFTILWTYMSFGQFVIIWSGDVAEFTPWYEHRIEGGWLYVILALMLLQFFVPFFLLLSRRRKRNLISLAAVAILIIVMRFVDMTWIVLPEFHHSVAEISWMDIAAPVGLVGIFLAIFAYNMQRAQLLPLNDPNMEWLQAGGH